MASTAHSDPEMMMEYEETNDDLEQKAKKVAQLLKNSKHAIIFTGAGISTSAGIPDFRGPQGIWTLEAQGRSFEGNWTSTLEAIPTPTHMSIVELIEEGYIKFLVSQNVDGLHRKSGIRPEKISELHGNTNLEKCVRCETQYMRDFDVSRDGNHVHDHRTGRKCAKCRGELHDSIINFGEGLPKRDLALAFKHAEKADLCISLGSSLTVTPAAHIPKIVGKSRLQGNEDHHLVICNLQRTPLDPLSDIRVHAKTDLFMERVLYHLGLTIPEWRLNRIVRLTHSIDEKERLTLRTEGMDVDETPASIFRKVTCEVSSSSSSKNIIFQDVSKREPFQTEIKLDRLKKELNSESVNVKVTFSFMGHYLEPDFSMEFSIPRGKSTRSKYYELSYNPYSRTWSSSNFEPINSSQ